MRGVALYLGCPKLLRFGLWEGLAAMSLVSLPCVLNIPNCGIKPVTRSFPVFANLWEVSRWLD